MWRATRRRLGQHWLLACCWRVCCWRRWRCGADVLIRFSHVVARDTPKGLAVERFKQLVEQRSGGRIRVAVYPAARLYSDLDEMEALRLGAVEMLAPSLSKFGPIGFPEFELFDLPFLFERIAGCAAHHAGRRSAGACSNRCRARAWSAWVSSTTASSR